MNGLTDQNEKFLPPASIRTARQKSPNRLVWICSGGVFAADLVLLALVIITGNREPQPATPCLEGSKFCVPCESLRLSPGENKMNFRKFGYSRVDHALAGECCAGDRQKLQTLVEIFVKRRRRIQRLKELANDSRKTNISLTVHRKSAHLVMEKQNASVLSDENRRDELVWDIPNNSSSFLNGFELRDGRVVVLQSGYYYVYSQIMFEDFANGTETNSQSVCHFLVKDNPSDYEKGDKKVFENSQARITESRYKNVYSSYIGGVSYLFSSDSLAVKASGSGTRINPHVHKHGNFFGLYEV